VGYNETSKDYKIFIPAQRKIVVSRYVKFEENLASRSILGVINSDKGQGAEGSEG
jgi:hypothetical protein